VSHQVYSSVPSTLACYIFYYKKRMIISPEKTFFIDKSYKNILSSYVVSHKYMCVCLSLSIYIYMYMFQISQKTNPTLTPGPNVHRTKGRRLKEHTNISARHHIRARLHGSITLHVSSKIFFI